jgi:hypothetical protein
MMEEVPERLGHLKIIIIIPPVIVVLIRVPPGIIVLFKVINRGLKEQFTQRRRIHHGDN